MTENIQELKKEVTHLVSKNRLKKALKLLSDKVVDASHHKDITVLMADVEKLRKDKINGRVGYALISRERGRINVRILELLDAIVEDMEESKKMSAQQKIKSNPAEQQNSVENYIPTNFVPSAKPNTSGNLNFDVKKYGVAALIVILAIIVFFNRSILFGGDTTLQLTTPEPLATLDQGLLNSINSRWQTKDYLYFEDFSNPRKDGFRSDIWETNMQSKDFQMQVKDNAFYQIDIEKRRYSVHRFIGSLDYHANHDVVPIVAKIGLDPKKGCRAADCLGRGITVRYDNAKRKKFAYAWLINDDGQLSFIRLSHFKNVQGAKKLYTENIVVPKSREVELGLVSKGDEFFLYLNRKLLAKIEDANSLDGEYHGVVAIGKGSHIFKEITVWKEIQ